MVWFLCIKLMRFEVYITLYEPKRDSFVLRVSANSYYDVMIEAKERCIQRLRLQSVTVRLFPYYTYQLTSDGRTVGRFFIKRL